MPKDTKYRDTRRNRDYFQGDFRVYLYGRQRQPIVRKYLRPGATIRNHVITVRGGSFSAEGGDIFIQTTKSIPGDRGEGFSLPYDWVDIVVQDNGVLIWQNHYPHAPGR